MSFITKDVGRNIIKAVEKNGENVIKTVQENDNKNTADIIKILERIEKKLPDITTSGT